MGRGEVRGKQRSLPVSHLQGLAERNPVAVLMTGVVLFSIGPVVLRTSFAPAPVLSFWRLWFGVLLLGSFLLIRRRFARLRTSRHLWRLALRCGVVFGLQQVCFIAALQRTSVAHVSFT